MTPNTLPANGLGGLGCMHARHSLAGMREPSFEQANADVSGPRSFCSAGELDDGGAALAVDTGRP